MINPEILLNANDGGIFKTLDCAADTVEWISLNNGYQTTQLYSVTTSRNPSSNIILGGFQDILPNFTFSKWQYSKTHIIYTKFYL